MKKTLFILGAFCALAFPALAGKERLPRGDFQELLKMNGAKAARIISPQTIALDDGRIVTLAGIDFPDLNPYKPGSYSVLATSILKDMLEKKSVNVYQTRREGWGRVNRMDHELAHLERAADGAWVQGTLVALGLARVMTDQRNPEMAAQMYALEKSARDQKMGFWSDESFKTLSPDEASLGKGETRIVEGLVRSVATKQSRIYLNFGEKWQTDFTAVISPENRKEFTKRGSDPAGWGGKRVRVRGWIGDYNGPFIEIDHPERVELLDSETPDSPLKNAPSGSGLNSLDMKKQRQGQ